MSVSLYLFFLKNLDDIQLWLCCRNRIFLSDFPLYSSVVRNVSRSTLVPRALCFKTSLYIYPLPVFNHKNSIKVLDGSQPMQSADTISLYKDLFRKSLLEVRLVKLFKCDTPFLSTSIVRKNPFARLARWKHF